MATQGQPFGTQLLGDRSRIPGGLPDDDLTFSGVGGAECERFITAVRKKARAEGKLRDNDWMVDLVSSCLTGDALRWYAKLKRDQRDDWDLLQEALLDRYPAGDDDQPTSPTRSSRCVACPEPPCPRPNLSARFSSAAFPPQRQHPHLPRVSLKCSRISLSKLRLPRPD